jgi:glucan biosynthesis protein
MVRQEYFLIANRLDSSVFDHQHDAFDIRIFIQGIVFDLQVVAKDSAYALPEKGNKPPPELFHYFIGAVGRLAIDQL